MEKKMNQKIEDTVDRFIESLEEMIDSRDDMWIEECNCNHREMMKIREKRYEPARENVRSFLLEILKVRNGS